MKGVYATNIQHIYSRRSFWKQAENSLILTRPVWHKYISACHKRAGIIFCPTCRVFFFFQNSTPLLLMLCFSANPFKPAVIARAFLPFCISFGGYFALSHSLAYLFYRAFNIAGKLKKRVCVKVFAQIVHFKS